MVPGEDPEIILGLTQDSRLSTPKANTHDERVCSILGAFLTLLLLHLYRLCSCSAGVDTPSERVDGSSSREK